MCKISLCFLPPQIDGSLLGGTIDHHHHPHHEHDHDHGDGDTNHNNKSDPHTHGKHIQGEVETSTPISAVSNLLPKTAKNDKNIQKSSSGSRKGRKFNRPAKRREKKIDLLKKNRPFPFRIPRTSFSCRNRAPGYYADMEADCQVYRMCTARGGGQAFLCPEGTSFNQRTLVCDHKFRVTCSESSNFFHRNLIMHEESMRATEKARIRNKGSSKESKGLRKRPRLQSSEIINLNPRPRPNVIRTGRLNGRLRFAPLFEKKRKENFEKFAKALDMSSHSKPTKASSQRINRPTSSRLTKNRNIFTKKETRHESAFLNKSTNTSRKHESKKIKSSQLRKTPRFNINGRRNQNRGEENLLGLPELPEDIPKNSPIFTFKTGPRKFPVSENADHHKLKENLNSKEIEDDIETIGGQLLPPVAAGKSVAKFHKDTEGPINNQLAVFLTPPPPLPKSQDNAPLQLVGHVMTSNELSAFPDSPIVNIKQVKSDKLKDNLNRQPKINGIHFGSSNDLRRKKGKLGPKRLRNGRLNSKKFDKKKGRAKDNHSHQEKPRSSGGKAQDVGLPIQLRPSGRGMPAPLVWISPASLARSPMVSLRKLESPNHNELFKSGNVERTLTMTFPGRSTGRFNPSCLECMSIKQNTGDCPPCFLLVR